MILTNIAAFALALAFSAGVIVNDVTPLQLDFSVHRNGEYNSGQPRQVKRSSEASAPLYNIGTTYMASLKIGSNEDEVNVILDTGSSDLWVMGLNVRCYFYQTNIKDLEVGVEGKIVSPTLAQDAISEQEFESSFDEFEEFEEFEELQSKVTTPNVCALYGTFSRLNSKTFKQNETAPSFYIKYADQTSAYGIWGTDDVKFGNTTIESLSFAVVNTSSSDVAVLGIGLPNGQVTNLLDNYTYENFPLKLRNDGIIQKSAYSLYLNSIEADTGSILFGAIDHAKYYGTLQTVPLINIYESEGYGSPLSLEVMVTGFGFNLSESSNSFSISKNSYPAILDSGSTYSYIPRSLLDEIALSLGANVSDWRGLYTAPCPANPNDNLTINFGGNSINVPLTNIILPVRGRDTCSLTFRPQSRSSHDIVFGDDVLRNAYIVYDLEDLTISLANVEYTTDTDIELIPAGSDIPRAIKAEGYSSTSYHTSITESGATTSAIYSTGLYSFKFSSKTTTLRSLLPLTSSSRTTGIASTFLSGTFRPTSSTTSSTTSKSKNGASGPISPADNLLTRVLSFVAFVIF